MMDFKDYLNENYKTIKVIENEDDKHKEMYTKSVLTWNKRRTGVSFAQNNILKYNQIVFVDFGFAFVPEMAFGHPAILLRYDNRLCKVLPITSTSNKVRDAYHPSINPHGKKAYYLIPKGTCNLQKDSCALVKQLRTISESRILRVIDVNGLPKDMYSSIRQLALEDVFPDIAYKVKHLEQERDALQSKINMMSES